MYNFIYYFFYQFFVWKKDNDPKDSALYALMVAIFFHGFFLLILFNHLTDTNILASAFGKNHSKFFWIPFVAAIMFLIHRVFKRKSEAILAKYRNRELLTAKHVLLVLAILIGPLIIGIQLLNK